jgi:hypothetical protein
MFAAGVQALASLSPALKDPEASLLPDLSEVRDVSLHVAAAVAKRSVEEGHSRVPALAGMSMEQIEERIKSSTWCVASSFRPFWLRHSWSISWPLPSVEREFRDPVYRPLELVDLE